MVKFLRPIFSLTLSIVILLPITFVDAHGGGESYVIESGDYQIDIDSEVEDPEAGENVRFEFDLLDREEKGLSTDFDYVWVRIQKEKTIVFAGGIGRPEFGGVGMTTTFPESGDYIMSVRFLNNGEEIAEGETVVNILSGELGNMTSDQEESSDSFFGLELIIGLITGALLVHFLPSFLDTFGAK